MSFHTRNITPGMAIEMFGVNYEGKYNTSDTALKRYSLEMRKYVTGFAGSQFNRIYTAKEIEVLRYIKRRTIAGVSIQKAALDAVSVYYEIIY